MVIGHKAKTTLSRTSALAFVAYAAFLVDAPAHAQSVSLCTGEGLTPPEMRQSVENGDRFAEGRIPVVSRPDGYDFISMDAEAKQACPPARVIDIGIYFHDHLIIYNFVDHSTAEVARFSDMQSEVIETSLQRYAPASEISILLVNIDVTTYPVDFATYFENNDLIVYDAANAELPLEQRRRGVEGFLRPYLLVEGSGLQPFDFALMNGVQNDADLNNNARTIFGVIGVKIAAMRNRVQERTDGS